MAVRRSTESIVAAINAQDPFCGICHEQLQAEQLSATTPCQHRFHDVCISNTLKTTPKCPVCEADCNPGQLIFMNNTLAAELHSAGNAETDETLSRNTLPCQDGSTTTGIRRGQRFGKGRGATPKRSMQTRSMNRNHREYLGSCMSLGSNGNKSVDNGPNVETITYINEALQSQQRTLIAELKNVIKASVEQSLQEKLATLNVRSEQAESTRSRLVQSPRGLGADTLPNSAQNSDIPLDCGPYSPRGSNRSNSSLSSEKAASIMQTWRLKFDGSKDSMQIDEFLYRIRSLTAQNLNGDYRLLCDNLHLLFFGKANDWFWSFHKKNPQYTWLAFCTDFRLRFEDVKDDFDLWELIRKRRQKDQETFDDFQSAIEGLVSQLSNEISEDKLVDLLKRNARTALRYELLHLKIRTRAELREEVKKHESFCRETGSFPNRTKYGREIQNKKIVCWNCDKVGHRFDDCMGERRIFCYGCGAKNTFKPNCSKCNLLGNRKRDAQTNTSLTHPTKE
nr:uncharacterized protein LOC116649963 [Drosophila virilis]XP_032289609.1 uncharacterized protein LOC116650327 [Drosophila virilis]XP_032292012.1 uncharacterized protein LOC116650924 [Drosophila virilis]XP_032295526.1 uncharacterized protein LOC116652000 [Drosophila virilis]XP_032295567.1 uncharacterized protein LOC116652022 [Drosophila virilis]XP_032295866.1 uncharacterized protein LOC116652089 [Drosophila virilis]XP_032295890.1 uncharacterized protein LOC116652099 [Drosophila virilis]XP_0